MPRDSFVKVRDFLHDINPQQNMAEGLGGHICWGYKVVKEPLRLANPVAWASSFLFSPGTMESVQTDEDHVDPPVPYDLRLMSVRFPERNTTRTSTIALH